MLNVGVPAHAQKSEPDRGTDCEHEGVCRVLRVVIEVNQVSDLQRYLRLGRVTSEAVDTACDCFFFGGKN